METTLQIDDQLLARARHVAEQSGRTLTEVVEDALREVLPQSTIEQRQPVRLPIVQGQGVLPGINLDNSAALRDLMDGFDAAH